MFKQGKFTIKECDSEHSVSDFTIKKCDWSNRQLISTPRNVIWNKLYMIIKDVVLRNLHSICFIEKSDLEQSVDVTK